MRVKNICFCTFLLFSCRNVSQQEDESIRTKQQDSSVELGKQDTIREENKSIIPAADGLQVYRNMEWVEYCLPLPLNEYRETFDEELNKGEHRFIHKQNKANYIEVMGMMRSDEKVSLEEYFKNTYSDAEENGKIITRKNKMTKSPGFYFTGYYNNKIYEERFMEVVWFRSSEVVVLQANYSINDTTQWNIWLEELLTSSSMCN